VGEPNGNLLTIKLGPNVPPERIRLNERVTVSYSEEVATSLQKLAGPPINKDNSISREEEAGMNMNAPTVAEQNWVEATPSGDTDFSTVEVTDTVAAINYNKRIITFAAANGQTRKILIDPSAGSRPDPGRRPGGVARDALDRGEREDHLSVQLRLTCRSSRNSC